MLLSEQMLHFQRVRDHDHRYSHGRVQCMEACTVTMLHAKVNAHPGLAAPRSASPARSSACDPAHRPPASADTAAHARGSSTSVSDRKEDGSALQLTSKRSSLKGLASHYLLTDCKTLRVIGKYC